MNKVTIIGLGYVGLSLAAFLGTKTNVVGVDSNSERISILERGKSYFYEPKLEYYLKKSMNKGLKFEHEVSSNTLSSDFVFVTVGTPINNDKIDLRNIKNVIQKISELLSNVKQCPSIVIKSTVIPGTTDQIIKPILSEYGLKEYIDFNLLTNPEFLKEGSAMHDTVFPHVIVIGGSNEKPIKKLVNFYNCVYPKKQKIIQTNNITAEVIKYANNSFLATKLSFINSIANLCQRLPGTNVDKIAEVIGMDPRIGNQFLRAGPGYGGSCFPKDVQALISFANSVGYKPDLLDAVKRTNLDQITSVLNLIKNNLKTLEGKRITILGSAFKENTDDIREAPALSIIDALTTLGATITAYDPEAMATARTIFGDAIQLEKTNYAAIENADGLLLLTEWQAFRNPNFERLKIMMRNPVIFDGRNIFDPVHLRQMGFNYYGIGRK